MKIKRSLNQMLLELRVSPVKNTILWQFYWKYYITNKLCTADLTYFINCDIFITKMKNSNEDFTSKKSENTKLWFIFSHPSKMIKSLHLAKQNMMLTVLWTCEHCWTKKTWTFIHLLNPLQAIHQSSTKLNINI